MTLNEFYKKAVEGGLKSLVPQKLDDKFDIWEVDYNAFVLMPEAWQAVGKVEGWGGEESLTRTLAWQKGYKGRMHAMIDALIAGGTPESYIETL